jgi:16S rRNA (cytosine1402-N4)-methyltransferase|tara:strand:- start:359 stop:1336 length:978 start_codon:yes stop_codon:yes gene_type:complete
LKNNFIYWEILLILEDLGIHHKPVMIPEILKMLNVLPGGRFVDATLGESGHAKSILKASDPGGEILGIDADHEAIEVSKNRLTNFSNRATIVNDNFKNIKRICMKENFIPCHGILFDLGVSSLQLDTEKRGFSFKRHDPLDMRFSFEQKLSAKDIINTFSEKELADIIFDFGEDRKARKIAEIIVNNRPLEFADELAELIKKGIKTSNYKIHPATKTFQAIRIYINEELSSLHKALDQSLDILGEGGRIAVISYHSLEDRIVKNFFKKESKYCICLPNITKCECNHKPKIKIITKKPLVASVNELQDNRRSRSAKLRVAERIKNE